CGNKANKWKLLEIVFDGVKSSHFSRESLSVVYTADIKISQNADEYIIKRLEEIRKKEGKIPVILVTDDAGLRNDAFNLCSHFMSTFCFYDYLTKD
ncbi:MAG: NYN domain-containing protein, partial [Verrucomicrobiota bacterium]|nr:NYN domain-containing protein [Verrucomicrobiota bacterium]